MPNKKTKFRRRREGKTDYKARLSLLKSGIPRVVVRKTNCYIIAQLVTSRGAQDYVVVGANSWELLAKGFPKDARGSLKSLPAGYLTGILLASKIKKLKESNKLGKLLLDIGLQRSVRGSRIYAVAKGLIDSGIKLVCSAEMLPDEKRIYARHMKKSISVEDIKNKII